VIRRPDVWAVVPVKRFAVAKRRLTPALGASERTHLARIMFEDVLDALSRASDHLAGLAVVTADKDAARLAERHNAIVVSDEGYDDINRAIRLGVAGIVKRGAGGVLVVPSDIPQLSPEAVVGAVDAIAVSHSLAAIRATQDGGTNLLACRPATMIPLCFGPDSFENHCRFGRAQGMKVCTLPAGDLGLDIDRPEDLLSFVSLRPATRTLSYLATVQASEQEQHGSACGASTLTVGRGSEPRCCLVGRLPGRNQGG
jgi:2-phospho-L-lactate guanylyltransferase